MKHTRTNAAARSIGLFAFVAVGCTGLFGCSGTGSRVGAERAYPQSAVQGESLDIQVVRGETTLTLTNTTSRVFGPCTLWVNAYYSRPLEGLAVGQSLTLPLKEFRNEHGESFRGGGFFATKKPERMVLAQIEHDGTMYPLVVTRGEPVIK